MIIIRYLNKLQLRNSIDLNIKQSLFLSLILDVVSFGAFWRLVAKMIFNVVFAEGSKTHMYALCVILSFSFPFCKSCQKFFESLFLSLLTEIH